MGTIFAIQRNSFVDGPGIRTTVFLKGCNLHCKWCHNPESQNPKPQIMHYLTKCTGCGHCMEVCPVKMESCILCGRCVKECPQDARQICGREAGVEEIMEEVRKDSLFYETSGGGVTFSGGECMLQIDFLEELLKKCQSEGIHTAVDTAGNVPWSSFERILPYTDVFLYDIKAVTERLHIEGTGVSNRQILENLRRLSTEFSGDVIIRTPVMEGYNATEQEMEKIGAFLAGTRFRKIELLAYNEMIKYKYDAVQMPYTAYGKPDEEKLERLRECVCWQFMDDN